MATLRQVHDFMNHRRTVVLSDGRTGKISRVDTFFPKNETVVTVWLKDESDAAVGSSRAATPSPATGLVKVGLDDVAGSVPLKR